MTVRARAWKSYLLGATTPRIPWPRATLARGLWVLLSPNLIWKQSSQCHFCPPTEAKASGSLNVCCESFWVPLLQNRRSPPAGKLICKAGVYWLLPSNSLSLSHPPHHCFFKWPLVIHVPGEVCGTRNSLSGFVRHHLPCGTEKNQGIVQADRFPLLLVNWEKYVYVVAWVRKLKESEGDTHPSTFWQSRAWSDRKRGDVKAEQLNKLLSRSGWEFARPNKFLSIYPSASLGSYS